VALVLAVFAAVYAGMLLGGLPGTALDRTGVAVVGVIALLAGGALSPGAAWQAIDVATIALLFGFDDRIGPVRRGRVLCDGDGAHHGGRCVAPPSSSVSSSPSRGCGRAGSGNAPRRLAGLIQRALSHSSHG
jgi:hypothetical protein